MVLMVLCVFVFPGLKPAMANCFDFRQRTTSFDLHNIGQGTKMSLLSKLFRSKSDSHMKVKKSPTSSPSTSPKGSPRGSPGAPPRRRFIRVVRDDQAQGEEYINPHVVRKYNPGFWEKHHIRKSQSLDEACDRPLPYTVSGHTILKKHHSVDSAEHPDDSTQKPDNGRHAKFKDDVEILQYDIKGKCLLIHADSCVVHTKLHDDAYEQCLDLEIQSSLRGVEAIDIIAEEVETKHMTLEVISETDDHNLVNSPEIENSENTIESKTDSSNNNDTTATDAQESSAPKKSKHEEEGKKTAEIIAETCNDSQRAS